MRFSILAASLILLFSWIPEAWSQKGVETSTPIQIEADRMESSTENSAVLFFGNIKASQGDLVIHADEMTVLYTKIEAQPGISADTTADLSQNIDKIIAKGNVKIVQGDWVAVGDTMDFNADARIVILAGNATAWQEQNMVSGEKIVLYLNDGKSIVESGPEGGERVKAFIYPSPQEEKGSKSP